MKWLVIPMLTLMTAATVAMPVSGSPSASGVPSPARARQNWILSCQGCHRASATGTPQTTPSMAGFVGQFLQVPGGREYLAQVPGVATADLSDSELAEVLNTSEPAVSTRKSVLNNNLIPLGLSIPGRDFRVAAVHAKRG